MRTLSDRQQRGVAAAGLLLFAGVLCFMPPAGILSAYVTGVLAGAGAYTIWRTRGDRKDAMPGASVRGRAGG